MSAAMKDNITDYQAVVDFRDAMAKDGWQLSATYDTEPADSAITANREGFTVSMLSRDYEKMKELFPWMKNSQPKRRYECSISIWGPDGMCIKTPASYDWSAIKAGITTCHHCGKTGVETMRYGFASRACADCLPALKAEHEKPGWCD